MYARNQWYAAAVAAELTDQLLARTILAEPIRMYRTTDGQGAALEDRCSHRNVPLSLGKRIGDRVQCPYHGLEFGAGGACRQLVELLRTGAATEQDVVLGDGLAFAALFLGQGVEGLHEATVAVPAGDDVRRGVGA